MTSAEKYYHSLLTFGIMPGLGYKVKGKANKNLAIAQRALDIVDEIIGKKGETTCD